MLQADDTYMTIADNSQGIYKEKGSKFIALAYPAANEDEVKAILTGLRKEYHDARHHCYAYIIGAKKERWRMNDDGEPSGTAGRPIHGQILSHNVTNILIVVVRYFGGTKLGVSGLINAYKTAAADALSQAKIVSKTVNDIYRVTFSFSAMNDLMRLIKEENPEMLRQEYGNDCMVEFGIRQSRSRVVVSKLEKIESVNITYLETV